MEMPYLIERFADNGEHSHWVLEERDTGRVLWEERDDEELEQDIRREIAGCCINDKAAECASLRVMALLKGKKPEDESHTQQ